MIARVRCLERLWDGSDKFEKNAAFEPDFDASARLSQLREQKQMRRSVPFGYDWE